MNTENLILVYGTMNISSFLTIVFHMENIPNSAPKLVQTGMLGAGARKS